jgi:hypothetical protein
LSDSTSDFTSDSREDRLLLSLLKIKAWDQDQRLPAAPGLKRADACLRAFLALALLHHEANLVTDFQLAEARANGVLVEIAFLVVRCFGDRSGQVTGKLPAST